ncbi:hypothetical protein B0H67DRAFT_650961 [Lasiosphaeris hirsuta]|uniref:Uncharacterized protein n=1 Tax=Lasiosphaeris hirsuta TaxID=260670 RepID=A0AA40B8N4_9PEZI|nr:hypothetical protein B0H67DRAFT_650961 [Lasiosphaeris hirsuta]
MALQDGYKWYAGLEQRPARQPPFSTSEDGEVVVPPGDRFCALIVGYDESGQPVLCPRTKPIKLHRQLRFHVRKHDRDGSATSPVIMESASTAPLTKEKDEFVTEYYRQLRAYLEAPEGNDKSEKAPPAFPSGFRPRKRDEGQPASNQIQPSASGHEQPISLNHADNPTDSQLLHDQPLPNYCEEQMAALIAVREHLEELDRKVEDGDHRTEYWWDFM